MNIDYYYYYYYYYYNYYLTLNLNPTHLKFDPDGKLNLDTTNLTYTAGTGINLVNRVISAKLMQVEVLMLIKMVLV